MIGDMEIRDRNQEARDKNQEARTDRLEIIETRDKYQEQSIKKGEE